jgi:hypothetical protein
MRITLEARVEIEYSAGQGKEDLTFVLAHLDGRQIGCAKGGCGVGQVLFEIKE